MAPNPIPIDDLARATDLGARATGHTHGTRPRRPFRAPRTGTRLSSRGAAR